MKKIFFVLLIGIGVYAYLQHNPTIIPYADEKITQNDQIIADAFLNQTSNLQV